jgi:hypothetical protein
MLFKQSIINDANTLNRSSRYALLLEERELIGFRVELERSESSYRENNYRSSQYATVIEDRLLQVFE